MRATFRDKHVSLDGPLKSWKTIYRPHWLPGRRFCTEPRRRRVRFAHDAHNGKCAAGSDCAVLKPNMEVLCEQSNNRSGL